MAERLADGLWQLQLGWAAPFGSNAYVLTADSVTLVDSGLPFNSNRLRAELADAGVRVPEIDRLLLTHYDLDHVGGLSRLAPDLEASIHLGEADLALLHGSWHPPWFHHKGLFHRGLRQLYRLPSKLSIHGVADGDRIGGFEAHHTPGHNPGHTTYVHESLGIGFLGDLVWSKPHGLVPPSWLDSYDSETLRQSIRRFAERAPPFEIAAVGHGEPLRTGGRQAVRDLAASC
jgi:glyoxylase-like metal-dependent hydrolase (beta-lactamase superfamily II)